MKLIQVSVFCHCSSETFPVSTRKQGIWEKSKRHISVAEELRSVDLTGGGSANEVEVPGRNRPHAQSIKPHFC